MLHAAPSAFSGEVEIGVEPLFDFLAEEYSTLFRGSCASAFQAPHWLAGLHTRLAPELGAHQHTVTVRAKADGKLLAVFPFVRQSTAGILILQPADFGLCDRNEPVASRETLEMLAAFPEHITRLAAALGRPDLLLMRKVWEGSFDITRLFPGARAWNAPNSAYLCETGDEFAGWKQDLRKKFTKELDRLQRQTARDIGTYQHRVVTDPNEIKLAFEFLRLARLGRHKGDVLEDDRFYEFYRDYAIEGAQTGESITYASFVDGYPVAVLFGLAGDGEFHAVLIGADFGKLSRQSTGIQLLYRVVQMRIAQGYTVFDMGLGDPGYKAHFRPRKIRVHNVTRPMTPTGHAAAFIYNRTKPLKNLIKGLLPNVH